MTISEIPCKEFFVTSRYASLPSCRPLETQALYTGWKTGASGNSRAFQDSTAMIWNWVLNQKLGLGKYYSELEQRFPEGRSVQVFSEVHRIMTELSYRKTM